MKATNELKVANGLKGLDLIKSFFPEDKYKITCFEEEDGWESQYMVLSKNKFDYEFRLIFFENDSNETILKRIYQNTSMLKKVNGEYVRTNC